MKSLMLRAAILIGSLFALLLCGSAAFADTAETSSSAYYSASGPGGGQTPGVVLLTSPDGLTTTPVRICKTAIFKHIASGADTQILAAVAGKNIYVCDYSLSAGGANNFYLEKSNSGTCSSPTQIAQTWYVDANGWGKSAESPFYRGLNTGQGYQLCAHTTQSASIDVTVYVDQQP